MYVVLNFIVGVSTALMIFLNGSLEGYVGNYTSLLYIHISGLLLISLSLFKKEEVKQPAKKRPWFLLAGSFGIIVVSLNNIIFSRGGVLLTLGGTLTGQVLAATVMELYKVIKKGEKLHSGRIVSLILVIPGAIIIGSRSGLNPLWIILSWLPGILIMIQAYFNSQNIISYGFKITTIVHYLSAFILLLIGIIFIPQAGNFMDVFRGEVPIYFAAGGGFVSVFIVMMGSFLLLKIKPITYVLLMYSGQLCGALFLDYLMDLSLSMEKIVALILIVSGLLAGEFPFKQRSETKK